MSKTAIELLRAIGFLDADNSVADLSMIPQQQLAQRLSYYHEKRSEYAERELTELAGSNLKNAALLSSISSSNAVIPLCPKLLIQEALIVNDPVYKFAAPEHEHSKVEKQALGIAEAQEVDVPRLQKKLSYFKDLAPFIEAGFLHAIPLAILHRPPLQIPLNAPKNLYRELMPPKAIDFIKESAIVRPMRREQNEIIVLPEANIQRNRQVCLTFKDDKAANASSFYFYRDFEILGQNPDGSYKFSYQPWSEEPLDVAQYDIWIEQSINQTVGKRLESIAKEMQIADLLGAPYLTESNFEAALLAKASSSVVQTTEDAINFLEANLDLLNLENPAVVYGLRTDNEKLLTRFRLSLANIAERLKGLSNEEYHIHARQLFESEIQPQIAEVNAATQRMVESAAKGAIQAGSAFALAIMTGNALPICAMLPFIANGIASEAIPAVGDYLRLRNQPQYLWYKLNAQ